jgi:hypothetical protein
MFPLYIVCYNYLHSKLEILWMGNCYTLFEGDDDGCGDLAEAKAFYKMACQDDVKAADNRDFSMDSMMAFGAACEAIKNFCGGFIYSHVWWIGWGPASSS